MIAVDTSEIQERFVEETRQKFADAGYDPSKEDVRILVTRLPAALFESLFGRVLQPMHGAEARPAPRTNEIYIDQAKRIAELETIEDGTHILVKRIAEMEAELREKDEELVQAEGAGKSLAAQLSRSEEALRRAEAGREP